MDLSALFVVPLGLGLLGFIEPCTVGSSLLFVKYLEGRDRAAKVLHTVVFAATRALFIGGLGALAALIGTEFLRLQRGFWILLGVGYMVFGMTYIARRQGIFARALGPRPGKAERGGRAAALGLVFGLNVPACAAPILGALLAASFGAGSVARGFVSMAVFGLALSLPLVVAVMLRPARAWLDRLAAMSTRAPLWTGLAFLLLGGWAVAIGIRA